MPDLTADTILGAVTAAGQVQGAAEMLGVSEPTLRRRIKSFGLQAEVNALRTGRHDFVEYDDPERLAMAAKDAELRQLRREHKAMSEKLGQRNEFLRELVEGSRIPVETPAFDIVSHDLHLPERSILLPIYDLQFGQLVQPSDVTFAKGAYSEAIFLERLEMYVSKVCRFLRDRATATNFTELHIVLGGDLVEGDGIYPGMPWQLEMPPTRQVLKLRVHLRRALKTIVRFAKSELGVDAIALYAVPGNHGKVGGKRAGATPTDYSWDDMVVELLYDDLRAEPIDLMVNESSGALLFETQETTFFVIHGEQVKGHAGIPFYGFSRLDGRAMRLSEAVYDYGLSGHIHQPMTIPTGSGGEWIGSGDWVGGNNMSGAIVAASRPQQRVILVGRKYGVTEDARIYFDDRTQRVKPRVWSATEAIQTFGKAVA